MIAPDRRQERAATLNCILTKVPCETMQPGNYAAYDTFGPGEPLEADPYTQCLTQDFFYSGNLLGPFSKECKLFMADRCAKKWDNACEVYSTNRIPDYPDEYTTSFKDLYTRLPEGQKFIKKTAERKFCKIGGPNCRIMFDQFNPTAPNTPQIHEYTGQCEKVCDKFNAGDANDVVLRKCAEHPGLCDDTLWSMCYEAGKRGMGPLLEGTVLGGQCLGTQKGAAAYKLGAESVPHIPRGGSYDMGPQMQPGRAVPAVAYSSPDHYENETRIWPTLLMVLAALAVVSALAGATARGRRNRS